VTVSGSRFALNRGPACVAASHGMDGLSTMPRGFADIAAIL